MRARSILLSTLGIIVYGTPLTISSQPTSPPLRVLGLQIEAIAGRTDENCAKAEAMIRANPGYDLYVLPELSCPAYDDSVLASLADYAEAADGPLSEFFGRCAREANAHVCYGFIRRTQERGSVRYSICQAVATPHGTTALVYDKMHLCDMGLCSEVGSGFEPGSALGVFECNGVRVGVTVCYDLRFPELYRSLAWGAECDLILHPSAFVRDATFPTYHPFVTTRAVENGVYILSVNFAGSAFGDSIACPPWVGPVPGLTAELAPTTLGREEGVLPLIVEPSHLAAVRRAYPYRRNVHASLRQEHEPERSDE